MRRQPFGGWKRSTVGPGTKAGGPNYLIGLSDRQSEEAHATTPLPPEADRALNAARRAGLETDAPARALHSDARASRDHYARSHDPSGLRLEHNLLRYRPVPVEIRVADGDLARVVRVAAAAALAAQGRS